MGHLGTPFLGVTHGQTTVTSHMIYAQTDH